MKKIVALLVAAVLLITLCGGCKTKSNVVNPKLDLSETVKLTICGPWTASKAFEAASQAFYEKYPNCEIVYEYVQNYEESLTNRLKTAPESVDLFLSTNAQADSPCFSYAEELFAHQELDLSDTNQALIKNFTLKNADPDAAAEIYAIPLGGELRGMYVNKTLLSSLNIEVPATADEFFAACQILKDAGYIPMNGNPGMFAQRILYPYVCNLIANAENYQELYDEIARCDAGVSELFRQPMQFMYTAMEQYYYNYKYVETELNMFTDNSDEGCARYFFNVLDEGSGFTKKDDVGSVAFMSGTLTQQTTMDKIKDDYHSNIDYAFILSPVSNDGGFAYISPAQGLAVNRNSSHLDWAVEFMNFLFSKEANTQFAANSNYIPNTTDSFAVIRDKFDIPENHISDLGQMTFNYDFYSIITNSLMSVSKGNNPKYMNTDANGNSVIYPFEHYMDELEAAFAAQRESGVR